MNMSATKKRCLKRLGEIEFEVTGAPPLVKQVQDLKAQIEVQDFDSLAYRAAVERKKILESDEIFPGAAGKSMIPIEFPAGNTVRGKVGDYCAGHLKLWTVGGIIEIPYHALPEDLQENFPFDPGVEISKRLRGLFPQALACSEETKWNMEFLEHLQAAQNELARKSELVLNRIQELETENAELKARPGGT